MKIKFLPVGVVGADKFRLLLLLLIIKSLEFNGDDICKLVAVFDVLRLRRFAGARSNYYC